MIIHPKFIFAHMPRTGGTFIEEFLKDNVSDTKSSQDIDWLKKHHPMQTLDIDGRFVFGVVRNPFDYYVSLWHFERREYRSYAIGNELVMANGARDDFKTFVRQLLTLGEHPGKDLWDFQSMREFDVGVVTWRFLFCFCHKYRIPFSSGVSVLAKLDLKDILFLNHVIRFELLKADLYTMFAQHVDVFGTVDLNSLMWKQKVNVSPDRGNWHSYYDDDLKALVREKDAFIFDNFYS